MAVFFSLVKHIGHRSPSLSTGGNHSSVFTYSFSLLVRAVVASSLAFTYRYHTVFKLHGYLVARVVETQLFRTCGIVMRFQLKRPD